MSVVEFGHFVLTIAVLLVAVHGLGYLAERLKSAYGLAPQLVCCDRYLAEYEGLNLLYKNVFRPASF